MVVFYVFCLSMFLPISEQGILFNKIVSRGNESILSIFTDVNTRLDCAVICNSHRCPLCTGFVWHSSKRCQILKSPIEPSTNRKVGRLVYKSSVRCNLDDGFQQVDYDGCVYCYHYYIDKKKYVDARSHCNSLGAHLLHLHSQNEKDALESIYPRTEDIWVGVNDMETEGKWVADIDGSSLDSLDNTVWEWNVGEPNDHWGEDCVVIGHNMKMNDVSCNVHKPYFCERTLV